MMWNKSKLKRTLKDQIDDLQSRINQIKLYNFRNFIISFLIRGGIILDSFLPYILSAIIVSSGYSYKHLANLKDNYKYESNCENGNMENHVKLEQLNDEDEIINVSALLIILIGCLLHFVNTNITHISIKDKLKLLKSKYKVLSEYDIPVVEKIINQRTENLFFFNECSENLQDYIIDILNTKIEYRYCLNIPENLTFGVEIEYEKVMKLLVDFYITYYLSDWDSKVDRSLFSGGEVTSPILINNDKSWQELKQICDYLEKKGAYTCGMAGGHIHIGANILGNNLEAWRKFIKMYILYEDILFRFGYGDKISSRDFILYYAGPIANELYKLVDSLNEAQSLEEILNVLPPEKNMAINFKNVKSKNANHIQTMHTIEIRYNNATTISCILQNNINVIMNFINVCNSDKIDENFLNTKLNRFNLKEFYEYNEINIEKALELANLIFDKDIDKLYFMRQYLKNFEDNYSLNSAVKAKKFY